MMPVATVIGKVAEVATGQAAPQGDEFYGDDGCPFVRAGSLVSLLAGGPEAGLEHIHDAVAKQFGMRLFPAGTVVFAKSGMSATKGLVYCLKHPCYVVSHLACLIPSAALNSSFLVNFLTFNSPTKLIQNDSYPAIRTSDIAAMKMLLPPLGEQLRIATILDKADEICRKRQGMASLLNEIQGSVFDEMFGDPVSNTKGWPRNSFGNLGELDRGRSKHRPRNAPQLYGGPYPFIQTGDVANCQNYIREYQQTYSELGLQQSRLWKAGTLCITIAANIAKTGILTFDACFPDSIVGFQPCDRVSTEYIHYWLKFMQQRIERAAPESAQKNINLEILRKLSVPVPPIALQKKFSLLVSQTNKLSQQLDRPMHESENLFNSLQGELF